MRRLVIGTLCAWAVNPGTAFADPLCGVPPDAIFKSRYEAGEVAPPSYNPLPQLPPAGTPLTLSVLAPANSATIGSPKVQVHGTFTGPPNTGISVNGVAALQSGNAFLSREVSLVPGTNTITVRATTSAGATQEVTRSVTYDSNAEPVITFGSVLVGDFAPFSTRFLIGLKAGIPNPLIQRLRIDFNGDGTNDLDTTDATTRLSFRYQSPALYLASAEVTLDDGVPGTPVEVITATRRVIAEDLDITRATLCNAYEVFRSRLRTWQYTGALELFNIDVRPKYAPFFEGLGVNGTTVADGLGEIADGVIGLDDVELQLVRPIPLQPGRFHRFPLQFERNPDGVWRVSAL